MKNLPHDPSPKFPQFTWPPVFHNLSNPQSDHGELDPVGLLKKWLGLLTFEVCEEPEGFLKNFLRQWSRGTWHMATINGFEKYIPISWFWAFLEVRALQKVLMEMLVCSVPIVSCLDSHSCHIGVPRMYNMGFSYWALNFWLHFVKYLKFWGNGQVSYLL